MRDILRQAAELSRRSLLRNLAVAAGGATMLGATAGGNPAVAQTKAKVAQKSVAYQDKPKGAQRCDNCTQFEAPSSCKVVEGSIAPDGWCGLYVKKPA